MQLTAFSYNIHKGFNVNNRRFLLHEIRHAIRTIDADLVFLQEVVGHGHRYGQQIADPKSTQFEYLAEKVWPHHAYGRNALREHGHHGNAILSKTSFDEWRNVDLTQWKFSQRGLLMGKLKNNIYVCNIHLGLLERERRQQLKKMVAALDAWVPPGKPLIIAGDFNDWKLDIDRHFKQVLGFKEVCTEVFGKPAKTYPAKMPVLQMDRMYYRNLSLRSAKVMDKLLWRHLSDHCALMASFNSPSSY